MAESRELTANFPRNPKGSLNLNGNNVKPSKSKFHKCNLHHLHHPITPQPLNIAGHVTQFLQYGAAVFADQWRR